MKEIKENKYYIDVVILNKDEWEQHIKKVLANRGFKTDDEILEECCTFDFKFGTISAQPQSSSSETQNPL